jgi:hypothetical protein
MQVIIMVMNHGWRDSTTHSDTFDPLGLRNSERANNTNNLMLPHQQD